jgi:hypothetical protein
MFIEQREWNVLDVHRLWPASASNLAPLLHAPKIIGNTTRASSTATPFTLACLEHFLSFFFFSLSTVFFFDITKNSQFFSFSLFAVNF